MLIGLTGAALIATILWDAFETVLVPRRIGRRIRLTRYFYMASWRVWRAAAQSIRKPSRREALLGFFGPISLILLLICWATGLIVAFTLLHLSATAGDGVSPGRLGLLLYMSGETFFTLGYGDFTPSTGFGRALSVLESGLGFAFLGTVVGYLPTIYSAFAQREVEISLMDARAGSPPTAAEFLSRMPASGADSFSDALLSGWERWSAQLLEAHISYPQLAYYRSQHSNQSWLGTLVTILDSTALMLARVESPPNRQTSLTFAMARHALVDISHLFVPRFTPGAPDRLPGEALQQLRDRLAGTPHEVPAGVEFEHRLSDLRRLYEPYAQALGFHLLFELPPWIHAQPGRDNWHGGPWDRAIAAQEKSTHRRDDHF
ncbi:MAG: two pore domain potassium channel family protein [Candidatus Eisenbacteria bacterium]|uniref:Two pore domain potassium channel family protein n=1 Tax=Eiseniibacteriota bacterium TaxID=2212470 RepID=A0A849SUJ3_UNCEI|nr:two pore domain potassium channel family protein [Candidatus Eisenbacteria bacterium]